MSIQKYIKTYEIYYHQIDCNMKVKPIDLMNLLEETAISHSESAGLGIDGMKNKGMAWVINRWNLVIEEYPKRNDFISIETWASFFGKSYAVREFCVKNAGGGIIAYASTLWILIDIKKRCPARVPAEYKELYGLCEEKMIENPFGAMKWDFRPEKQGYFFVRRSDIDTNGHVNNSKYIEWAMEHVPDHIYDNYFLYSLEAEYKKEIVRENKIISHCRSYDEGGKAVCLHRILNQDEKNEFASLRTVWMPKPHMLNEQSF